MLTEQTLDKMNEMKMTAFAEAFENQLGSSEYAELSFEEKREKVKELLVMQGKDQEQVRILCAGDIGAVTKLESLGFASIEFLPSSLLLSGGIRNWIARVAGVGGRALFAASRGRMVATPAMLVRAGSHRSATS